MTFLAAHAGHPGKLRPLRRRLSAFFSLASRRLLLDDARDDAWPAASLLALLLAALYVLGHAHA